MYKLALSFSLVTFTAVFPVNAVNSNAIALDNLVSQWTQLEQQHSEIDNRWQETKPLLQQQLQLLKEERMQLQGSLEQHATASDEVEKERFDLLQQQTNMEVVQHLMEFELAKTSSVLLNMYKQLPPPLKEQWNADIALLASAKESADNTNTSTQNDSFKQSANLLSSSEKLDKILNLLNQIEQFEQRVALHQTTMQVMGIMAKPKMIEVQVDQVYLGLSQGWYLSKDEKYWGTGNSSLQGWKWKHQNSDIDVSQLRLTIQMLTDPVTAALVVLPVQLSIRPVLVK
jgi:hypothetical protein